MSNSVEQAQATPAFEALKEGGDSNPGVMLLGMLLEEVAPALENAQAAAHAGFQPGGVVERGTVVAVFGGV